MDEFKQLVGESGYECAECGKDCKDGWTIDHQVPLSSSGQHSKDNMRVLCLSCNSSRKYNQSIA